MKKIPNPKFIIKAVGPSMDVELPVYRGNGTKLLRRLKRIHDQALEQRRPKLKLYQCHNSISIHSRKMKERDTFRALPENRLRVEIINLQAV